MPMITCPNCGYKQADGPKCVKCSSLFSYYLGNAAQQDAPAPASNFSSAQADEVSDSEIVVSSPEIFARMRAFYRVFRWVSLATLILVILLIMHKSAPPQIVPDPQAAARVESKLAVAQATVQQGQPYQLTLDGTELNSFLGANLAIAQNSDSQPHQSPMAAQNTASDPPSPDPGVSSSSAQEGSEPTIDQAQSSVQDLKVDLVGDLVKVYVVFNFHGKDLSFELDGHLSSSNGYIQFQPVSGQLGSLSLPQFALQSAVDKLMASPENKEKLRLPDGVRDIQIVDGQLVVSYQ